jgi:hypothetical protein
VEPRSDLISMMAHSDATRHMDRNNLLGNLILLIVGGNDTTRNSMTGSVLALNENPDEYDKLRSNHALIDSFVPEVIRWQTPLAHMRRTALQDTQVDGIVSHPNLVRFRGYVAKSDAVRASVTVQDKYASGAGKLSAITGRGTWSGRSGSARCSGYWTARRN